MTGCPRVGTLRLFDAWKRERSLPESTRLLEPRAGRAATHALSKTTGHPRAGGEEGTTSPTGAGAGGFYSQIKRR